MNPDAHNSKRTVRGYLSFFGCPANTCPGTPGKIMTMDNGKLRVSSGLMLDVARETSDPGTGAYMMSNEWNNGATTNQTAFGGYMWRTLTGQAGSGEWTPAGTASGKFGMRYYNRSGAPLEVSYKPDTTKPYQVHVRIRDPATQSWYRFIMPMQPVWQEASYLLDLDGIVRSNTMIGYHFRKEATFSYNGQRFGFYVRMNVQETDGLRTPMTSRGAEAFVMSEPNKDGRSWYLFTWDLRTRPDDERRRPPYAKGRDPGTWKNGVVTGSLSAESTRRFDDGDMYSTPASDVIIERTDTGNGNIPYPKFRGPLMVEVTAGTRNPTRRQVTASVEGYTWVFVIDASMR